MISCHKPPAFNAGQNPESGKEAGTAAVPPNSLLCQAHHDEDVNVIKCNGGSERPQKDGLELGASNQSGIDKKKSKVMESEREICAIDIESSNDKPSLNDEGSSTREQVCRICQLNSEHESENYNLIQLGCACKDDLGLSHYHCAVAWFTRKGNRTCEICGKSAKNIIGITKDTGFTREVSPEYNEIRSSFNSIPIPMSSHHGDGSHFCAKTFCNFILACFLVAFFMPWIYHFHKA